MADVTERREEKQKKGKKLQVLIILLLLALIGLGAGIYYQMTKENELSRLARDELALGGMLPGKSEQEISDLLGAKIAEGMVDIGISAEPIFERNGKKGRLGIENIAANHYSFQVELKLDETGETIYKSGLIDPGYYVEFVELNKTLQAGDYQANAVFTTYSLAETEDQISEVNVKILLHVMDGTFY